jgi:acetylornithine deacetylase/succinyl-diaminopimelate desuccinylase-like protein
MKSCKLMLLTLGLVAFALAGVVRSAEAAGETSAPSLETIEQEAVSLLNEYLRVDTTNPPGNEIKAAQFFKDIFDREGIEAQIIEAAPGRGNIYARLKGDGSKKAIVLMNHMDVVPADRRYWSVDPFGGVVKDGYVWGRGALDMKGMGIVELMAMLALKRQGIPLKSDIIFLGVADEEAGGAMGAGFMVKEHFDLLKNAGIVLNEFNFIAVGDDGKVRYYGVEAAQKTPLWLKLTATGTPGHGSVPRSDSAVNKLIAALHRIANYQTPLKVEPVVQTFYVDTADLEPSGERRQRLKDLKASLQDPAFAAEFTKNLRANAEVRNTISITVLEGSNKVNVIPPQASAQLDVRLLPSENPQQFINELRKVIGDESINIEPILSFAPSASPTDSEFFKALQEVANNHNPGARVTTPLVVGFTDCHYFREKGIPCYGFMPFKLTEKEAALLHGNDERLSVDNVKFGTRVMYEIVQELAAQ